MYKYDKLVIKIIIFCMIFWFLVKIIGFYEINLVKVKDFFVFI